MPRLSAKWEGFGLMTSDLSLATPGEGATGTQLSQGGTPSKAS